MRSSLALTLIALFGSVAYGFSSQSSVDKLSSFRWRSMTQQQQHHSVMQTPRGGARMSTSSNDTFDKSPGLTISSLWGTGGVLYILMKAIKRVIPIALEPFQEGAVPLSQFELG